VRDWERALERLIERHGLEEQQRREAERKLERRKRQLRDYLAGEADSIAEYRHERYRLAQWEADPTAGQVPFQDARIAAKRAEVASMPHVWLEQVRHFEHGLENDLRSLLAEGVTTADLSLSPPGHLALVDKVVTYWILAVGVCLVLGLFARTAALGGAAFLLAVIVTQPPWVEGAQPVYYQLVEMLALVALATTAVGRWGGLDFFLHALRHGCCRTKEKTQ
jgi:uncharacterized membrane protein YphA (DoxX/SURF4 family)